ncbi:unannotated protein [freshwater metagenome]|uniref:Unannotated protein n=1 Tax=freshwater metagenome TaxID=449393 RepID=A0A6J6D195_9ZZZZ
MNASRSNRPAIGCSQQISKITSLHLASAASALASYSVKHNVAIAEQPRGICSNNRQCRPHTVGDHDVGKHLGQQSQISFSQRHIVKLILHVLHAPACASSGLLVRGRSSHVQNAILVAKFVSENPALHAEGDVASVTWQSNLPFSLSMTSQRTQRSVRLSLERSKVLRI